ncbi:dihydrolipoamide acetyltransferase family protein [Paenibacillus aestuarii]|uniref:Dihydrolipoamide acetyltransferase component of pyruvate dehydrogenase complex n=1 Tax=Paenibacillus aestuarii TaxID=516965 RepID=A0ABW0K9B0_9BACL|nr:dihydrolipoamide acetyltransferase family protein [Paenibacillus aestuarii]
MYVEWKLPDVGEGIHEAEIVRILVKTDDVVQADQVILEMQTDKAVVEIPSPVHGKVVKINVFEGELVRVGTVVFAFETINENQTDHQLQSVGSDKKLSPILTTPYIRKLARELAIDLQSVTGTGKGGRILEEDLRAYKEKIVPQVAFVLQAVDEKLNVQPKTGMNSGRDTPTSLVLLEERVPLRGLRKTIAERMVQSIFTAPQVTGMDDVDVSELVKIRKGAATLAAEQGIKLTYLPFIIKAVVSGLKKYPYLNAVIDADTNEIILKRYFNIGIAVDTPEGLLVPVIKHADTKSIMELAAEISELTEKALNRTLLVDDLQGSTFTISNIGSFGGKLATPILNYPEVAIMATGRITRKPVVQGEDSIVIRDIMTVSLTFDHRVIDGGMSARFNQHVFSYLENPILQLLELR